MIIFIGVTIIGIQTHKLKFLDYFIPVGTPKVLLPVVFFIEFLSYFSRAFSLGVRLAANITSGHVLINIISGFINYNNNYLIGSIYIIPIIFYF